MTLRSPQVAGGTSFGSDASGGAVGTGHWIIPAALVRGHQSYPQPGRLMRTLELAAMTLKTEKDLGI